MSNNVNLDVDNKKKTSINSATPEDWDDLHKVEADDAGTIHLTDSQKAQLANICYECG
tara:strand:- start:828 stop:1001 length:174 start_codon:yes stop_codon:yes gene_type:complete